jgi:hypothetical protein
MPTAPPSPVTDAPTSTPLVQGGALDVLLIVLGVIAIFVIVSPWLFTWRFKPYAGQSDGHGGTLQVGSFFAVPYVTWWLLHYIVAVLGILAIVILGVDNILSAAVVSGLLGGLFGYVLGSASKGPTPSSATLPSQPAAPSKLQITGVIPNSGQTGDPVSIQGTGFVTGAVVAFGTSAARAAVISPTAISVIVPNGLAGTAVDVSVTLPDQTKTTPSSADRFTYI